MNNPSRASWNSPFPLSYAGKKLPGVLALSDASWLQTKQSSHLWCEAVESLWSCASRFMLSYDVVTHVILLLVDNRFWVCTSMFLIASFLGINNIRLNNIFTLLFVFTCLVPRLLAWAGGTLSLLYIIVNAKKMGTRHGRPGSKVVFLNHANMALECMQWHISCKVLV